MGPIAVSAAIAAAIAATTADGLKEVGKKVVLDSYEVVKKAIKTKLGQENKVSKAIAEFEANPESKGRLMVLDETMQQEAVDQDPCPL